jgi:hypothetical protein
MTWENKNRPRWCPHQDCKFRLQFQDAMCGGELPDPAEHDGDFNHLRICLNGAADNGGVFDLQINRTDIFHLRRLFDSLQKAESSTPAEASEAEQSLHDTPIMQTKTGFPMHEGEAPKPDTLGAHLTEAIVTDMAESVRMWKEYQRREDVRPGSSYSLEALENAEELYRRVAALAVSRSPAPTVPRDRPMDGNGWWCWKCKKNLDSVDVTYQETHDPRQGGCGEYIGEGSDKTQEGAA